MAIPIHNGDAVTTLQAAGSQRSGKTMNTLSEFAIAQPNRSSMTAGTRSGKWETTQ